MKGIKLFDPVIGENEIKKVVKTLKSGFWASGAGSGQVHEFETKFKTFIHSKSCVAVNSGTAALHLAASLCNIKGKEVTPFILQDILKLTKGDSLKANIDLINSNSKLAAKLALKLY